MPLPLYAIGDFNVQTAPRPHSEACVTPPVGRRRPKWRAAFLRPPPGLITADRTPEVGRLVIHGATVHFRAMPPHLEGRLRRIDRWRAYAPRSSRKRTRLRRGVLGALHPDHQLNGPEGRVTHRARRIIAGVTPKMDPLLGWQPSGEEGVPGRIAKARASGIECLIDRWWCLTGDARPRCPAAET